MTNVPFFRERVQKCVKPKKSNVSGFPSPWRFRLLIAQRPNWISLVLSGCNLRPNSPRRARIAARNALAAHSCSKPRTISRVKEWLSDGRAGLSVDCRFPSSQCLNSPVMIGSPFPSHPTVRSVFPNTAVRQPSSQSMHRCSLVPDEPTANVDNPLGVQPLIRVLLPPETSAFTSKGQVASKASIDESL